MNKRIWIDRYCGHEQKRYKTMRRAVSVPTLAAKEKKKAEEERKMASVEHRLQIRISEFLCKQHDHD